MKALFVTKRGAAESVIQAAKAKGVAPHLIVKHGRVRAVYRRGELIGYQGFYPVSENGYVAPIMESV